MQAGDRPAFLLALPGTHGNKLNSSRCPPSTHIYPQMRKCHLCNACIRAQSCLTLFNPRDYSPPDSSVQRISQARILECVAIASSQGSSWPSVKAMSPASPALAGRFFATMPPGKHIWAVVLREHLGGALYVRDREQKYGEDLRAARDMAPGNLTWISHILTASRHWQGIYGHTISFSLSHLKGARCYFSWDGPICAPANTLCQRGQLLLLPREISDNPF